MSQGHKNMSSGLCITVIHHVDHKLHAYMSQPAHMQSSYMYFLKLSAVRSLVPSLAG